MRFANPELLLRAPFLNTQKEAAARIHAAAAPLGARARDQRDPDLEELVYTKALLLNPVDADLYNHLSIAASLRKDYQRAADIAMLAIASLFALAAWRAGKAAGTKPRRKSRSETIHV